MGKSLRVTQTFIAILFFMLGGCGMAAEQNFQLQLEYEWPNGRTPNHKMVVQVDSVKDYKPGWFGLKSSPSIAKLPDPVEVGATVLTGSDGLKGKQIQIVIPKLEVENLAVGQKLAVGVTDQKACICVVQVPADTQDNAVWLDQWECDTGSGD